MRRVRAALATALVLLVGVSPALRAGPMDERVISVANEFVPAELTLAVGTPLEYTNLDRVPHNLISLQSGPDGTPVFHTETIGLATTVPVEGIDKLPPGVYDFTCTLHPAMLGTIYLEPADG